MVICVTTVVRNSPLADLLVMPGHVAAQQMWKYIASSRYSLNIIQRRLHVSHGSIVLADVLHESPLAPCACTCYAMALLSVTCSASTRTCLMSIRANVAIFLQVVFSQGTASTVGIFLRSWHQAGEGGAAVLYNWESSLLEVVFEALDPATMSFSLTAPMARRIGGPITHKPGQPLALRMMLDGRWACGAVLV